MVFRYCLGMIMSVSTLMNFSGAATPSSVVNLSIEKHFSVGVGVKESRFKHSLSRTLPGLKARLRNANLRQPRLPPYRRPTARNDDRFRESARGVRYGRVFRHARPSNPGSA